MSLCIAAPFIAGRSAQAKCRTDKKKPFAFQMSKPDMVSGSELALQKNQFNPAQKLLVSRIDADTEMERSGSKRSQRSEVRETTKSAGRNVFDKEICYELSIFVPEKTPLPRGLKGGKVPVLSVAQFHHDLPKGTDPKGSLVMFKIDGAGRLNMVTGRSIGRQEIPLVGGTALPGNVLGSWVHLRIEATWSKDRDGRIRVFAGQDQTDKLTKVALYKGPTSIGGEIYQKLGAYRSFLERDPGLAKREITLFYGNVRRYRQYASYDLSK